MLGGDNRLQHIAKAKWAIYNIIRTTCHHFDAFELNNLKLVLSDSTLKGYLNGELKCRLMILH